MAASKLDHSLAKSVAGLGVATVDQCEILWKCANSTAFRRLTNMCKSELLYTVDVPRRGGAGRPSRVYAATSSGVPASGAANGPATDAAPAHRGGAGPKQIEHQLLTNEFLVRLIAMDRSRGDLSVRTAFGSEERVIPAGRELIRITSIRSLRTHGGADVIPDAAFCVTHGAARRSVLFFVEADRGTESLISGNAAATSINAKFDAYRDVFAHGAYKVYGDAWGIQFRGFRVLFLTEDESRAQRIHELTHSNRPSGYIWTANRQDLCQHGAGACIWRRGGTDGQVKESILGSARLPQNLGTNKPNRATPVT